MNDENVLNLDLCFKEVKVNLRDASGTSRPYTLRELDGKGRDTYMNDVNSRMKYEKGQANGMKDMAGLQSKLIHLSLRTAEGHSVSVEEISSWNSSTVEALYKKAQELSGLKDVEGEKANAKKD